MPLLQLGYRDKRRASQGDSSRNTSKNHKIQGIADSVYNGFVIPHYGTIVVNSNAVAGNYCVLHTSTCIGCAGKTIGDGLYLSAGTKIIGALTLGNSVSIAVNSLVNKSFGDNVLLTGMPARVKREDYQDWYKRDGEKFSERVKTCEQLKSQMNL